MEFNATFVVAAISFIVFSLIMNWIFYKPIQKVVLERQKFIDENYDDAKKSKEKSEAILKDKQDKLQRTKDEAKRMLSEKTGEAKLNQDKLKTDAQKNALQSIDEGKAIIKNAQDETDNALQLEIEDLASSITDKIMGDD